MSHHENRDFTRQLRSYDFHEVGKYERGRTGVSFLGGLLNAPTKAPLVVADGENAALGEAGEEAVVAADVVAEAVDEDELGDGAAFGLGTRSASRDNWR
jgi:predicted alpha/beta-hydrolase family hydrolase